jgi:hypothetical protein
MHEDAELLLKIFISVHAPSAKCMGGVGVILCLVHKQEFWDQADNSEPTWTSLVDLFLGHMQAGTSSSKGLVPAFQGSLTWQSGPTSRSIWSRLVLGTRYRTCQVFTHVEPDCTV